MSRLTVYSDTDSEQALFSTDDYAGIADQLQQAGMRFERWSAGRPIDADTDNKSILSAYQTEIDRLIAGQGFQSCDVVSMNPGHPQKDEFRKKFLAEHTHSEDEVRFFVRGQGLFMVHIENRVYALLCEKNDLISVPANTRHWFDMGPNPNFTAIRLFNNPEGWVASFTGDNIALRFPLLNN